MEELGCFDINSATDGQGPALPNLSTLRWPKEEEEQNVIIFFDQK
jgi:hypothetical protein